MTLTAERLREFETNAETGTGLVRYDAMCRAIEAAYEVDEIKEIHDKAVALEHYERLAKNVEAEDRCYQIRRRAANKAGELLKAMEKAKGGGDRKSAEYHRSGKSSGDPSGRKTLHEFGISEQSSDWQKLAAIPKDEFETALATKSVRGLIDKRDMARKIYEMTPEKERERAKAWLAKILSVSERTVRDWLSRIDKDAKEARNKRIFAMWMACATQEEIAASENVTKETVSEVCQKMAVFNASSLATSALMPCGRF
jgi:hypothetical protein